MAIDIISLDKEGSDFIIAYKEVMTTPRGITMPQILKAKINRISLCPRGANQMPVKYKSQDKSARFQTLVKELEEGLLTAVVYAPDIEDYDGDWASSETVKEMCHDFLLESGEGINVCHGAKTLDSEQACVVESFLVQKNDPRFEDMKDYSGNPVDVTGAWAVVIKIEDEELRKEYREGKWNGVSMEGPCLMDEQKQEDPETVLQKVLKPLLKALTGKDTPQGETEMPLTQKDKDEITQLVKEAVTEAVGEEVENEEVENEQQDTNPAPEFDGDFNDEQAVKKHEMALELWQAEKDYSSDPVKLFQAKKSIAEKYAPSSEEIKTLNKQAGVEEGDSEEVASLKRDLHKAQSKSNTESDDSGSSSSDDSFSSNGFVTKKQMQTTADVLKIMNRNNK